MFKLKHLNISRDEVLRYLGYKNQKIDDNFMALINETIEESRKYIAPKYIYYKYKNIHRENDVKLGGTNLALKGQDIKKHLRYAEESVLMAVTIGSKIEQMIKLYEKTNLTKALILDSCATTAVEDVCDQIENYIKECQKENNMSITFRYSPGYGDLPLDIQSTIINVLKADKLIGLTASKHNLLMPRKSVTAIIGLIPKDKEAGKSGCEVCKNRDNCSFKKRGVSCGS